MLPTRDPPGGRCTSVVPLTGLQQPLFEHSIAAGLSFLVSSHPDVHGGQQVTIVHGLLKDGQLGRLVRVGKLGHQFLQQVKVVPQLDPPLPFHGVVQVSDLSALVSTSEAAHAGGLGATAGRSRRSFTTKKAA
jgi:hypothetical protein